MRKITEQQDRVEVIDYKNYTQHLVTVFHNKIMALSSSEYLSKFGIGSVEIRVLAAIGSHPLHKASDIGALISIDKGAVSRAIAKLENNGFINGSTEKPNGKQKRWTLADKGWQVHSQFIDTVKLRHAKVTNGVSQNELDSFNKTLQKMILNVDQIEKENRQK